MAQAGFTPSRAASRISSFPLLSAKTRIPQQGKRIYRRQRLLDMVTGMLDESHIWISAPAGAGKTVLAADYARMASCPAIWYELDLLDGDPFSFFSSFSSAFSSLDSENHCMTEPSQPQPEDMMALPVFARKFFRSLFSCLSTPWLLVLDNWQEIPEDSPLQELLVLCLREMPSNCRCILLSRVPPPPPFARMKSEGLLRIFDTKALRFNRNEIEAVMDLHGIDHHRDTDCIDYLLKTTTGWAAGVTLLLEERSRNDCTLHEGNDFDHQELFDYFTGVLFNRLEQWEKQLLMRAALLPDIRPVMLDRLCNTVHSARFFEQLSKKNFFTYALDHQNSLFQFHPMFLEFLRKTAITEISASELAKLQDETTRELMNEKRGEEAVELLLQAGNQAGAIRCILQIGMDLLLAGRFNTLLRWQRSLHDTSINSNPWLLFFFGNARIAFSPTEAIEILEQSFHLFKLQGDEAGTLLACSSLTNSIINHLSDLSALDPWLNFLEEHLDPRRFPGEATFENITISNAVFRALVLRRPDSPDLEQWLDIVVRQGGLHPALITHYLWTGRFTEARSALDHIYTHRERIGSRLQFSAIKAMEAQYYLIMGQVVRCIEVVEESLQLVEETGIRVWEVHFLILGAGCCLNCGDRKKAAHYLQKVEERLGRARLLEHSYYHVVKTLEALLDDDLLAADRYQKSALDRAIAIGMPSYSLWCWYGSGLVAALQDNTEQAMSCFDQVFRQARSPGNPWFICMAHLGCALVRLRQDRRDEATDHLQKALSLARERNYLTFFFFLPEVMERLTVTALEEGVETRFVRRLIRHWRLVPANPPQHLDDWPWPLRIYAMGRFSILRNDRQLDHSILKSNRPIRLLQAMIALGGRQVSKTRLADLFWPDSNGDEQAAALKITLHRLRKILDIKNAILQTSTDLTINPALCWIDCWQFERLAGQALKKNPPIANRNQVISIDNGEFLPACDESWSLAYRNHLRELLRGWKAARAEMGYS